MRSLRNYPLTIFALLSFALVPLLAVVSTAGTPPAGYGGWKTAKTDGSRWDATTRHGAGGAVAAGWVAVPSEHALKDSALLIPDGGTVREKTQNELDQDATDAAEGVKDGKHVRGMEIGKTLAGLKEWRVSLVNESKDTTGVDAKIAKARVDMDAIASTLP